MRILFLHGWHSVPGGVKPTHLAHHGHEVFNPTLDDEDFDAAVRIAQAEYDRHRPDVVVGSSRGGAVAMNIRSAATPLVLLCPAWKNWGTATTVTPRTTILHSREDEVIPFSDSVELVVNSGLPPETLIEVGDDHRLADPEPLQAMLEACERLVRERQLLVVRVMVLADSADAAGPSARIIQEKIGRYGVVTDHHTEQYWKMPELFELYFLLHPASATCSPFDVVLDCLGQGWDRHRVDETQAWAVWTPRMGSFCCGDARWANVEWFFSSSMVDGGDT